MRIYMDVVREDMEAVGVTEEDVEDSEMEKNDVLWQPLMGTAEETGRKSFNSFTNRARV